MVAITTLTAHVPTLHTGGRAAHPAPVAQTSSAERPATVVTVSDRAQQLLAEANAAQAVADIFALANGVARSGGGATVKTQALIAHDMQANEGLYIVWSSTE